MDAGQYLRATQLFLLARHANTGLQLGSHHAGKVHSWFPVLARQWAAISHFRATILQVCMCFISVSISHFRATILQVWVCFISVSISHFRATILQVWVCFISVSISHFRATILQVWVCFISVSISHFQATILQVWVCFISVSISHFRATILQVWVCFISVSISHFRAAILQVWVCFISVSIIGMTKLHFLWTKMYLNIEMYLRWGDTCHVWTLTEVSPRHRFYYFWVYIYICDCSRLVASCCATWRCRIRLPLNVSAPFFCSRTVHQDKSSMSSYWPDRWEFLKFLFVYWNWS